MKKALSLVFALALLFGFTATAGAAEWCDTDPLVKLDGGKYHLIISAPTATEARAARKDAVLVIDGDTVTVSGINSAYKLRLQTHNKTIVVTAGPFSAGQTGTISLP